MKYCAEEFGEITIATATTFYVVFTYGLLANSEAHRRYSTEPHLMMRWRQGRECTDTRLSQMGLFAEKARSWLMEAAALGPNAIDQAGMATGNRYLILELSNVRKTPVGWIRLAVSGTLEISGSQPARLWDELHLQDLRIGDNEKVEVTIADLFPIPHTAEVILEIDVMTYGAVDGGDVVNESSGDSQKSVSGEFAPTESKGPEPN